MPLQCLNIENSSHSKTAGRYILLNLAEAAGFFGTIPIALGMFFSSIKSLLDALSDSDGERFKKIIKDHPIKILKSATVALTSHFIGMIPVIGQIFAYSVAKKADKWLFNDPQKIFEKGYMWNRLQLQNKECMDPGFISTICTPIKGIITVAEILNKLFRDLISCLVSILTLR